MRVLSFRQPFAWLTVNRFKPVENRVWNTSFRGWFLVHASAQWSKQDMILAREMLGRLRVLPDSDSLRRLEEVLRRGLVMAPNAPWLQVGGIVGAARLESVLDPVAEQPMARIPDWRLPEQYGFVLPAALALQFTPCKGLQRWWSPKPELQKELGLRTPPWLWAELQKNG